VLKGSVGNRIIDVDNRRWIIECEAPEQMR
jgi:hypothetical protein